MILSLTYLDSLLIDYLHTDPCHAACMSCRIDLVSSLRNGGPDRGGRCGPCSLSDVSDASFDASSVYRP